MNKDDLYFAISTILGLLALLGLDWKLVAGRVATRPSRRREWSLLLAVFGSIAMSAIGLYKIHSGGPTALTLNISAYDPPYTAPMRVISDQTFEDQDVPLDGLIYQRCTFVNVCFLYDGGAYGLQRSTVKTHWKVCVKDKRLQNYSDLMHALEMFSPRIKPTKKTVVSP